jgi:hypothetical protein
VRRTTPEGPTAREPDGEDRTIESASERPMDSTMKVKEQEATAD